jgi:tRNA 2-selenouridine synthase
MAIQKLSITEFIQLAKTSPVLDVRSPGEYTHAHIPGAYSLPLFTDDERKVVGTAYKQQSRQAAIKIGLDYFGVKMKAMVEEVEEIISNRQLATDKKGRGATEQEPLPIANCVLVHCWRGGMRSAGVAWLLDLYGFKVYTLVGGYKAYRKWVRDQFEKNYKLKVLGGYTGSGKTLVLQGLKQSGLPVIDLEKLGNHKGSAFGAMGEDPQPTQEMFENLLAEALAVDCWPLPGETGSSINDQQTPINDSLWIEDESQRIGNLKIPDNFWKQMRSSEIVFLDIPFEERLNYLTEEYGKFEKEKLLNAIIRIQKRLGGLETKNAVNFLIENNHKECFRILLKYYDKWYAKGLHNRDAVSELLNEVPFGTVDAKAITALLVQKNKRTVEETLQAK